MSSKYTKARLIVMFAPDLFTAVDGVLELIDISIVPVISRTKCILDLYMMIVFHSL